MRVLGRFVSISALLIASIAAQAAVSPQRIIRQIDPNDVTEVPNRVPVEAKRAVDLGNAPDDLAMTELALQFSMTETQQVALGKLVADQQNPASPRYHQWITPEQAAEQFGLSVSDMAKVTDWLTSQGFTITEIARNRTFVRFSGSAGLVAKAFHTQIHRVSLDGESHVSNLSIPELPSAVAAVTASVVGLHDFKLKPKYLRKMVDTGDGFATGEVRPKYTSAATGNHFVAPGDFQTIYDIKPLHTAGINGSGVKIAVVGQTNVSTADLATFRSLGGLPAMTLQIYPTNANTGTNSNDLSEAMLDIEWSGVAAPNAQIVYVNYTNVISGALVSAVTNNLAPIISVSYGLCENNVDASTLNYYNTLLLIGNAQGQSIVIASGDSGATDCDYSKATATGGLNVDFPSDLPATVVVGGTQFNEGTGTYWLANNGTAATATGFIPSEVWNETVAVGQLESGGGGSSTFFTKPYWQVGTGVPQDNARDIPDVSLHAALNHDATLICTSGSTAASNFCVDGWKNSSGSHDIVGGTSIGAPAFAGILALVVQKTGAPLGNPNPKIYALANSAFYASSFHDVTVGDNKQPCTAGSTGCPAGGSIGYSAGVGYDLASGWGAPDVNNFVTNWPLVTPLVSSIGSVISSTTISTTATKVTQGTSATFNVTVASGTTSSTTTPTGTVQFLLDNVAQGSPIALVSGKASFTLTTNTIPNGAHIVRAAYSGDVTYAGSAATANLEVVSSGTPDLTIAASPASVSVTSGSTGTTTITVNGLNSFTGTVTLSATTTANATLSFSTTAVALSNTKTAGSSTLTFTAYKTNAITGGSASVRPVAHPWFAGSSVALAGLVVVVLPRRRRYLGALAVLLTVGLFGMTGCGSSGNTGSGGGGGGSSTTNTPAGSYTVTVTATGTSGTTTVTKTTTVTFVVN